MVAAALLAVLAASAVAPPASAELLTCDRGALAAEFEGRMSAAGGTARMRMRFTLQARTPGVRGYHRIAAPGFDAWTTSDPGVTRYVFTRRVESLIGPAQYRVRVRFRWMDAGGATVARATRVSRSCRIPARSTLGGP
jgi:hypothetical protein